MLTLMTLLSVLILSSAEPGGIFATPIHVPEEVYAIPPPVYPALTALSKQVITVPEPQEVTYTRTDVLSRKITSNVHPFFYEAASPHSIKHTHYTEENIVRGDSKPTQPEEAPGVEANFRRIQVDVPQPPQIEAKVQSESSQPSPPSSAPVEISAPILRSGPPTQIPLLPFPEESNKRQLPPAPDARLEPLPKTSFPSQAAPQLPSPYNARVALPKIEPPAPLSVGYPFPAAQLTDFRRTFYDPPLVPLPYSPPRIAPAVSKTEIYNPPQEPCNDHISLGKNAALETSHPHVRAEIHHGFGAVSTYF